MKVLFELMRAVCSPAVGIILAIAIASVIAIDTATLDKEAVVTIGVLTTVP